MSAERIQKLSDALGRCLDKQKQLTADVAELEAIAGAMGTALRHGLGNRAATDAWEHYKERKGKP